ncbi:MAG: amidohydrolase family protein [Planctomycetota bacterium]
MPGLVDTHSHLGGVGAADGSSPIQPGVRVMDSINVRSSGFRRALAGGLTTLNIMPGSGHLSSGRTVYAKLRFFPESAGRVAGPRTIRDVFILDDNGRPMGGLKMANGTNSIREEPRNGFPGTRGKSAALVRGKFIEAQEYAAAVARHEAKVEAGEESTAPKRDLDLETLAAVMRGEIVVHHHTHRADDIMTVLRLADEFGFRVVLHHVSEAWKVADEIAAYEGVNGPDGEPWGAPCSMILVDSPGGKLEAVGLIYETGGVLEKAGARVAMHTDDWITDSRLFSRMAALAVRAGMSRAGAIRSLTIEGARMLDLGGRVGSIEAGKDADLSIWSGDPLSVYSVVEETWVEGVRVFDRSNEADLTYAQGGYGAGRDVEPYFCCYDHLVQQSSGAATGGAQ